jgi:hypothetical protein
MNQTTCGDSERFREQLQIYFRWRASRNLLCRLLQRWAETGMALNISTGLSLCFLLSKIESFWPFRFQNSRLSGMNDHNIML